MFPVAFATDLQRFHQRRAGGEGSGKRSRESRGCRHGDDGADARYMQNRPIHAMAHASRAFPCLRQHGRSNRDCQSQRPAGGAHETRNVDDQPRQPGQLGAEPGKQRFKLRNDEDQQDDRYRDRHGRHRCRIEKRLPDLALYFPGSFAVGGDFLQKRFQRPGLLAGRHQIDVQVIEMARMSGERRGQRGASFQFGLHLEHECLHGRGLVAAANDVESLNQRDSGADHRRQLPGGGGDIVRCDTAAAREERPADSRRHDTLAPQLRAQCRLAAAAVIPLTRLPARSLPAQPYVAIAERRTMSRKFE